MILAISLNTNELLKIAFHTLRPYWISWDVKALSAATSFSMPSDRARNAVSCWGFVAKGPHRSRAWPAALFLVSIIDRSRVYLGVHFSWDVSQAGVWFGLGGRALVCDTLTCYALYYLRALLSGVCILALDPIVFIRLELDKRGRGAGRPI